MLVEQVITHVRLHVQMITEINHNRKINWSHVWAFIRPITCCCIWICYDYLNFSFWSVWYHRSVWTVRKVQVLVNKAAFFGGFVGFLFPNDRLQLCDFTLIRCGLSCEGVSSFLSSTFLSGSPPIFCFLSPSLIFSFYYFILFWCL